MQSSAIACHNDCRVFGLVTTQMTVYMMMKWTVCSFIAAIGISKFRPFSEWEHSYFLFLSINRSFSIVRICCLIVGRWNCLIALLVTCFARLDCLFACFLTFITRLFCHVCLTEFVLSYLLNRTRLVLENISYVVHCLWVCCGPRIRISCP